VNGAIRITIDVLRNMHNRTRSCGDVVNWHSATLMSGVMDECGVHTMPSASG